MKRVRTKYLGVLLCGLMIGLVLLRIGDQRSAPVVSEDWLAVSTPVPGRRTNSTGATPTISFCVSNASSRAVDFQVGWFECRAKRDQTWLATNQLGAVNIPLAAGRSTNLTIDICSTTAPVDEWLSCCEVGWIERRTGFRRAANILNNWMQVRLNVTLFEPKALEGGFVFAGNIDVGEYFRLMYCLPRSQSKIALVQRQPRTRKSAYAAATPSGPTPDQEAEKAFLLFSTFGERYSTPGRNAEPGTPPNAAPPRR